MVYTYSISHAVKVTDGRFLKKTPLLLTSLLELSLSADPRRLSLTLGHTQSSHPRWLLPNFVTPDSGTTSGTEDVTEGTDGLDRHETEAT